MIDQLERALKELSMACYSLATPLASEPAEDRPLPAAERERVFEKFVRLDPDQRLGVSGTGLGLYIARELVERMDGRIGLIGGTGGATFYVDLPAV